MNALPGPLARWSPLVADFPKDVALTLAPWMESLSRALGPLRAHTVVGEGDPDGVDGVTRRGPFDRLLDTERLLATEVPDEFVRRAAQSELLFHALALKETKPPRASLMLVDAGPAQIGAPRLAHLAIVLVLAARAREAGARFAWALMQDPPVEGRAPKLVLGVEAPLPALLILDRRALPPTDEDLAAWDDFALRAGWDDVWRVSEDARPSKRVRGGAVRVRDPVLRGVARLDLEVDHGGRVAHRSLALPEASLQERVLRDPRSLFAAKPDAKPAPPHRPAPNTREVDVSATPPIFLCGGRKVVTRNALGDPLVFTLPTAGQKNARPKRWRCPDGEKVIAAGWHRRRLVLLTRRGDALLRFDWKGDVFAMVSAPLRSADPALLASIPDRGDDAPLLHLHFPADPREVRNAVLRLDDGRALQIDRHGVVRVWRRDTLCLSETRGRLILACRGDGREGAEVFGVECAMFGDNRRHALLGSDHQLRRLAVTADDAKVLWRVEALDGATIPCGRDDTPFGVVGWDPRRHPQRVLALDPERREIVACGAHDRERLLGFTEPLVGAGLGPDGWEIAVVSSTGALRIFRAPEMSVCVAFGAMEVLP